MFIQYFVTNNKCKIYESEAFYEKLHVVGVAHLHLHLMSSQISYILSLQFRYCITFMSSYILFEIHSMVNSNKYMAYKYSLIFKFPKTFLFLL